MNYLSMPGSYSLGSKQIPGSVAAHCNQQGIFFRNAKGEVLNAGTLVDQLWNSVGSSRLLSNPHYNTVIAAMNQPNIENYEAFLNMELNELFPKN